VGADELMRIICDEFGMHEIRSDLRLCNLSNVKLTASDIEKVRSAAACRLASPARVQLTISVLI
jgi:hypothetical protein